MPRKFTEEQKREASRTQKESYKRRRLSTVAPVVPRPFGVAVNCSVKIDMEELARLPPGSIAAIMHGIAEVIAVPSGRKGGDRR